MITGDGAYIKKINRQIIIRNILKHGLISRADLSKITGLNKATISVQIADLLEEELICETQPEYHGVGRRPIMISINTRAGYVLGIDLDYKQIQFTLSDLQGSPINIQTDYLNTDNYDEIIELLVKQINKYSKKSSDTRYGLVSVVIGIHGIVNKNESVDFVTNYLWHNKNLKEDLEKKLDLNIHIENNANLSAYAEKVFHHHSCQNLIAIQFATGLGSGIIVDGKIQKGFHGYAGEIGHMIIYPGGIPCKCGNHGCWGRYTAVHNFIAKLAEELNKPNLTINDLQKIMKEDDTVLHDQIEKYITDLAIGLNNVINFYNPEIVVLNSEVLRIIPGAIERIKNKLTSAVSYFCTIELSDLGNKAELMGACALGIQQFLEVPELSLTNPENAK